MEEEKYPTKRFQRFFFVQHKSCVWTLEAFCYVRNAHESDDRKISTGSLCRDENVGSPTMQVFPLVK